MWRRGSALVFGYPRWEQLLEWQGKVKLCCWCKVAIVKLVEIWSCAGVKLSWWKKHSFKLQWLWIHILGLDQVTPFEVGKVNDGWPLYKWLSSSHRHYVSSRVQVKLHAPLHYLPFVPLAKTLKCVKVVEYHLWHTTCIYATVQMYRGVHF